VTKPWALTMAIMLAKAKAGVNCFIILMLDMELKRMDVNER
jgi:hypothetical protein